MVGSRIRTMRPAMNYLPVIVCPAYSNRGQVVMGTSGDIYTQLTNSSSSIQVWMTEKRLES